jgi:hypothetical protein
MIAHTIQELSRIMWEIDPMHTSCWGNPGMENEYEKIAGYAIQLSATMSNEEALKKSIIDWFDEYLYNYHKDDILKCLYYKKP